MKKKEGAISWIVEMCRQQRSLPFAAKASVCEILWAVLPGIIACLAILHPFFFSAGEFIYLDWSGTSIDMTPFTNFMDVYGQDGAGFRWIPFLLPQLPFVLLLGQGASAMFSRIFFLFIFILGSTGLFMFFREKPRAIYLLSAAIMFFSPFVYERIMMGQFLMVLSLASLPITLYFAKKFLATPALSSAWQPVLCLTLLNLQIQGLVMNALLVGGYFALHALFCTRREKLAIPYMQFAAMFLLFNAYWIAPYFALPKPALLSSIDPSHAEFFTPKASIGMNTLFKSAAMYGSWRESSMKLAYNYPPADFIPKEVWRWAAIAFVAVLMCLSAFAVLQNPKNPLHLALAFGWIAGVLVATGISHPWTGWAFDWLFQNVQFFVGFRDSNKWAELVVCAYALLAPAGAHMLAGKRKLGWILPALLIVFAIACNYVAIGLAGQLMPGTYPQEYMEISSLAAQNGTTIYLPWSVYNSYTWSLAFGLDGRIANPAGKFGQGKIQMGVSPLDFSSTMLSSENYTKCLAAQSIPCLKNEGVSRIIVDRCFLGNGIYGWVAANRTALKSSGCLSVYNTGG